jgi:hypothetical protein
MEIIPFEPLEERVPLCSAGIRAQEQIEYHYLVVNQWWSSLGVKKGQKENKVRLYDLWHVHKNYQKEEQHLQFM